MAMDDVKENSLFDLIFNFHNLLNIFKEQLKTLNCIKIAYNILISSYKAIMFCNDKSCLFQNVLFLNPHSINFRRRSWTLIFSRFFQNSTRLYYVISKTCCELGKNGKNPKFLLSQICSSNFRGV
jgi:hypothetical protein